MRALLIEPYASESHRRLLDGLQRRLPLEFERIEMPPRKWKWRMRGAALHLVPELERRPPADVLFCSAYLALTDLVALGPEWVRRARKVVYFHENQFVYPKRLDQEWDFHFALTNVTTALAADAVAFNSRYNRDSFFEALPVLLKRFPDFRPLWVTETIAARSRVLPVPLDSTEFENLPRPHREGPARIIWNHRWEYDKNPEEFFAALYQLDQSGVDFELAVMGQQFQDRPPVFDEAEKRLAHRIVQWGHLSSRAEYLASLAAADFVVSTAIHEFFGVAVMEAVRAGCTPVLPRRLAYPELFPEEYFYADGDLAGTLHRRIDGLSRVRSTDPRPLTAFWEWPRWETPWLEWLTGNPA